VYGVIRADAAERSPGEGVDGAPVEVVTHDGLAALVSDAPNVPVKASRRNLMAHSRVLQATVAETCVLPMRFGVVMPSREAVRSELLEANSELLHEHLRVLEPYVELDVRGLATEHELLQAIVSERADIARLRASMEGRPIESTYHESIRLGELVAHAVAEKREEIGRRIVAELEPLAAATRAGDLVHEQMVANVAFLVERERVGEFDGAVDALGRELSDPDVRVRYLGPLPPHNFVDLASETEARAWA
jgi:Gas vesicle synthesis protein GvpL/GvpF